MDVELASPFYPGLDGLPLQSGSIFYGVSGQNPVTAPVPVYWDAAGTQPASQPIQVVNGRPSRNGAPATLYISGDYSKLVQDAKGRQVLYEPVQSARNLGAISFTQGGVGALTRSAQNKVREHVSALDFIPESLHAGIASGTNVTDLTVYLQAAMNAALTVEFPDGTYKTQKLTARSGNRLIGPGTLSLISGTRLIDIPAGTSNVAALWLGLVYQDGTYGSGAVVVGATGGGAGVITSDIMLYGCKINGQVFLSRVQRGRVVDNVITNGGVQFDGWHDACTVARNTITNDAGYGAFNTISASTIDVAPTKHGNTVISDNVLTTYRMGIEWRDRTAASGASNNDTKSVMSNNTTRVLGSDINSFGISLNSDGWAINGNTVDRFAGPVVGTYGMEIVESSFNVISGNKVSGFDSGIYVYSNNSAAVARGNTVSGNTVTGCNNPIGVWRYTRDTRVIGNYIDFATGTSFRFAMRIDGDSAATDGTYGRQGERCIVMGNTLVIDTTADANSYIYVFLQDMRESLFVGNTIYMASGNAFSRGVNWARCDDLTVSDNKFVGNGGVPCLGVQIFQDSGRRGKLKDNHFANLSRPIDFATGIPFYNIEISGNQARNCANAARVFANSYAYSSNGSKVAYATAAPTLGTWNAGDLVFNMSAAAGWKCSVGGTAGALASRTGSVNAGSQTVTVNSLISIEEGQSITITGVTGTKKVTAIDRTALTLTIDVAADATVAGAAVAFVAPTFVALPF